jgi:23S rRNA (uridine2552-2'-O)-methyltransferase|tara:strand:- start:3883 stop:4509 length:627 start_codon:yes stop_codon:yes gene_type:complete
MPAIKNKSLNHQSKEWLRRHLKDPYVLQSQKDNYRSRAAYKLIEINQKFNIFKNVKMALDLGAAPGSWSEVLVKELKLPTKIVAIDLLNVDPISQVEIFKDDFTSDKFRAYIEKLEPFDLIVSDISPNMTGHRQTDFLRSMEMLEEAFALALDRLNNGGHFVAKYFRRGDLGALLVEAKKKFTKVSSFKPNASRKNSSEIYLVCYKKK